MKKVLALRLSTAALVFSFFSCNPATDKPETSVRTVEVRKQNGAFQLYRHGLPYFIKGAGGYEHFDVLKEAGGNSIRIWSSDNAQEILDQAHALGLTVTLGLKLAYAKTEMDYNNEAAVAAQKEQIKAEILKYKDHPALLMWGIGNELTLHLSPYDILQHNRTWTAINEVAKLIHELDPNHPTTTMLQDLEPKTVFYISQFCSDIDILSINIFRRIKKGKVSDILQNLGWNGPFVFSEYGSIGYWAEDKHTDWYALYERSSAEKFRFIKGFYKTYIEGDKDHCLGAYIFYWGQKHEYTPTWLSLFTETGEQTELIDGVQYLWTNEWPRDRAPSVQALLINGKTQDKNIYLPPKAPFAVSIAANDTEDKQLQLYWEIVQDDSEQHFDATYNQNKHTVLQRGRVDLTPALPRALAEQNNNSDDMVAFSASAPESSGPYRLFVYVIDTSGKVATANTAFYVID